MKRVSFRDIGLKYTLSPYDKPVARVKPGESIVLEVEDAPSGQIKKNGDIRDQSKVPFGNPVVGPIFVEGAEKGNTLSIQIEDIKPATGYGVTDLSEFSEGYLAGSPVFRLMGMSIPRLTKICKIEEGRVRFSDKIVLPYQPMVGTIGVAPHPEAESISSNVLPGCHGGNMDLPDLGPRSTVFLPVFHRGGLLYVGDVHAVQGDSEISGTAVEMPAEVRIKVGLSTEECIKWPRIETESEVMFVATSAGRTLEDAIRTAFLELALWIEARYGLNRFEGIMLCCQVGKVRIGNLWTVAAKIERKYLDALGSR